jgi:hypothetical protein
MCKGYLMVEKGVGIHYGFSCSISLTTPATWPKLSVLLSAAKCPARKRALTTFDKYAPLSLRNTVLSYVESRGSECPSIVCRF